MSLALSLRGFPSCSKIPEAFSTAGTAGKRLKAGGLKWKHQCLVWKGCVRCFPHEHQGEWAHHGELMGKISSGLGSWSRTCACIVGKDVSQRKSAFTAPICRIQLEPLGRGRAVPSSSKGTAGSASLLENKLGPIRSPEVDQMNPKSLIFNELVRLI